MEIRFFGRAAFAFLCLAGSAHAGPAGGDPARGENIYQACQDCHSLDKNDVGPRHRGRLRTQGGLPC